MTSVKYVVGAPGAMRLDRDTSARYDGLRPLPSREDCAELARTGIERAHVERPFDASDGRAALELLRFVRDALAAGIVAEWTVRDPGPVRAGALMHLPPPSAFPGFEADLERWRDFTFGVFYWRRGPGFAIVQDVRPDFDAAQYCIDDEACLAAFTDLQQPMLAAHARRAHGEALETLASAAMVLEVGGWVMALPYRIVTWPIPYSAI